VVREVREETGLEVEVIRYVGTVERAAATDRVYVIDDFLVAVTGGTLRPGDDANDAAWVPVDALTEWDLTEGLLDALRAWGLLGVNVGEGA
jgi:ADP-ribose pyrophosphatase YjhB (NUDIX family)